MKNLTPARAVLWASAFAVAGLFSVPEMTAAAPTLAQAESCGAKALRKQTRQDRKAKKAAKKKRSDRQKKRAAKV